MKMSDLRAIFPDAEDGTLKKALDLFHSEIDPIKDKLADAEKDLTTANTAKEKAEKDFADYKASQTAKETKAAKETAYKAILKECGVAEKYRAIITKGADLDSMELDDKGAFKNADKLAESIKAEHADFIVKETTSGAHVDTPPTGGNSGRYSSKKEIIAIKDTAERQKAISENHELFGF